MGPAEFRTLREYLGLTTQWVATRLMVGPRAVLRWESPGEKVPENAAALIRSLLTEADAEVRKRLSNEPFTMVVPSETVWHRGEYPPTWHRAIAARVYRDCDQVTISYEEE